MLRLIGRERIFRCILRLGLRCGLRLFGCNFTGLEALITVPGDISVFFAVLLIR